MIRSRTLFSALIAVGVSLSAIAPAAAQAYPTKPIKMIVPFPPGGPIDSIGRLIGQHMTASLGQNVIIEHRPGAGGTLGANAVANAPADGYTLLMGSTTTLSISPHLYKNIGYDPVKGLVPIATVSTGAMVLVVSPSVPISNVKELIAYAKTNPGKLNFGAGTASPPHLAGELFKSMTGTTVVYVPYRGAAPAVTDLLGGQIQFMIDAIGTLNPHIAAGKLKALAVTSAARNPALPNVPTMTEAGVPGYTLDFWTGVATAAGTPPDVIAKLNAAINGGLKSADVQAAMAKFVIRPNILSPQEAAKFMAGEGEKWGAIVKQAGVKIN
ncbi:MAG: tripartite tricarboxylate transporter substrate binding protein [Rhizobiales bacterium]|nr:tripartite tricarboxylate transporter substrate binding protein [Hyphomicrobiales bacterium]